MQLQTQLNFEKLTKYYCFQEVYRKKYEKKLNKLFSLGGMVPRKHCDKLLPLIDQYKQMFEGNAFKL